MLWGFLLSKLYSNVGLGNPSLRREGTPQYFNATELYEIPTFTVMALWLCITLQQGITQHSEACQQWISTKARLKSAQQQWLPMLRMLQAQGGQWSHWSQGIQGKL